MAEALLCQKRGHLHAAPPVVTQHSDGLVGVQLLQTWRDEVHGNLYQLKSLCGDAGRLYFPRFSHIKHHGGAVGGLRCYPVLQLSGVELGQSCRAFRT